MKSRSVWPLAAGLLLLLLSPAARAVDDEACLACHGDPEVEAVTARGKTLQLHVPAGALRGSVHEDLSCTNCHQGAESFLQLPHAQEPLRLGCPDCHAEAAESYASSDAHGRGYAKGNDAPFIRFIFLPPLLCC